MCGISQIINLFDEPPTARHFIRIILYHKLLHDPRRLLLILEMPEKMVEGFVWIVIDGGLDGCRPFFHIRRPPHAPILFVGFRIIRVLSLVAPAKVAIIIIQFISVDVVDDLVMRIAVRYKDFSHEAMDEHQGFIIRFLLCRWSPKTRVRSNQITTRVHISFQRYTHIVIGSTVVGFHNFIEL